MSRWVGDERGWKKIHLGVDGAGVIVAQSLTDGNFDDASEGLVLLDPRTERSRASPAMGPTTRLLFTRPPEHAARKLLCLHRKPRSAERDRTIRRVQKVGRRRWKKESGYHRQGRVENTFFRWKSIIGGRLRARDAETQETEALLACNVLNRMFELGGPRSVAIPR